MDRDCFFCGGEVGTPFPVDDGPDAACGACVGRIVSLQARTTRLFRAALTRAREHSVVRVAEVDGQQMLVRETVTEGTG